LSAHATIRPSRASSSDADLPDDIRRLRIRRRRGADHRHAAHARRGVVRGWLAAAKRTAPVAVVATDDFLGFSVIAHGEVEDLVALLPVELHPPLLRGDLATGGKAEQMELIEFIERVDDRTGVDLETGEDYARAVLGTLRETIGDDEFADIARELPREYLEVLAAA
jgi:uncharacterized protein (DUF2267 family)